MSSSTPPTASSSSAPRNTPPPCALLSRAPTRVPPPPPHHVHSSQPSPTSSPSWTALRAVVRESRRAFAGPITRSPTNFAFRTFTDVLRTRLYFLAASQSGKESTLLYVDVDDSSPGTPSDTCLAWNSLIESTFQVCPPAGKISKEEQLLWERKRCVTWGIAQFELHPQAGKFVFPAASSLFGCIDHGGLSPGPLFPSELKTSSCQGARLNAAICPTNPDLVAFVAHGDLWLTHAVTGQEVRLTYAHHGHESLADDPLTAGLPSYIMQEEFSRFSGFWWRPVTSSGKFCILYEEVDEREVELLKFPQTCSGEVEEFRFPRAGTANAKSSLKLVFFSLNPNEEVADVRQMELKKSLETYFPWLEYIVRVGWVPDGEHIWAQLLNRRQQLLELVLIPMNSFVPVEDTLPFHDPNVMTNGCHSSPHYQVLLQVRSENWITVNSILAFLPSEEGQVEFIWASEECGWRHLYLVVAQVSSQDSEEYAESESMLSRSLLLLTPLRLLRPRIIRKVALTSGPWTVIDKQISVDKSRRLVYFHGLKDKPLEKHFYVVSLSQPDHIRRLTTLGFSHSVVMNEDCSMFVTVYSSIQTVPACQVFRLSHSDATVDGITLMPAGWVVEPRAIDKEYKSPELFEHNIRSGEKIYGMIFKPHDMKPDQKYPVVLSVYGGPEVQLVSNTFKGMRQMRNHLLASQGFCVVCIDSRGSENRGTAFEAHIRNRMGQVEMKDQVEVLLWLGNMTGYMDMDRVAIHGWSYGGYLALMGLIQYPDVFKVSIAGAPVVTWLNYDSGYTERYMDLPSINAEGYKEGSILNRANELPDQPNRLLIVHGLMDENVHFFNHTTLLISQLIKFGKPYQLQVYPGERHSLRHFEASEHYEITLLTFLKTHL